MYKKSQQKRRTSPCNYKERFFVLNTQELTYSEPRPGVSAFLLSSFSKGLQIPKHITNSSPESLASFLEVIFFFFCRKSPL